MPKPPFAKQHPVVRNGKTLNGGKFTGGPFKIVHHTTEGATIEGALATYPVTGAFPHFTVDDKQILQHLDTSRSSTALKNLPKGVETNKDGAIQIEVVGFAAKPKKRATLKNIAKLCRWIEENHQVATEWPNGFPKSPNIPANQHNRDADTWNTRSGHYGHSQVPENTHVDPGYTEEEIAVIMDHRPLEVFVAGDQVKDAEGFLAGSTAFAAARPVVEAIGGNVSPASQTAVVISKGGTGITVQAQGIPSGTAFIPLRELRRLPSVSMEFTAGDPARIDISLTPPPAEEEEEES